MRDAFLSVWYSPEIDQLIVGSWIGDFVMIPFNPKYTLGIGLKRTVLNHDTVLFDWIGYL